MGISTTNERLPPPTWAIRLLLLVAVLTMLVGLIGLSCTKAHADESTNSMLTKTDQSLHGSAPLNTHLRSNLGGWFDGWGWIWSTNQGPGDGDYTDYTMTWQGRTMYLHCCEPGVYHMLESEGSGGSVYFTAMRTSENLINQYDTKDSTTIYHHKIYRSTYYVYVDAGWYQDVDGYYSEDYEVVTRTPRYGGAELTKVSSNPSITNNNSSYSTAGAVYAIFSDAACTNQIGSMTTNSAGKASTWGLNAGASVYVKETRASLGYNLDANVYRINIAADTYAQVNGGTVYEPPQTLTVRYFVDGDTTPIYTDTNLALGTAYNLQMPGALKATQLARKPNCTPGLNAWHTDYSLTKRYTGSILTRNLDLYARNVATLTYALVPSTILAPDLSISASMSDTAPTLNIYRDVLPSSRQVNWGATVRLSEPKYSILYHFDSERWRTLRRNTTGWFENTAMTGSSKTSKTITQDTTVYTDYVMSTFDGIVMW